MPERTVGPMPDIEGWQEPTSDPSSSPEECSSLLPSVAILRTIDARLARIEAFMDKLETLEPLLDKLRDSKLGKLFL